MKERIKLIQEQLKLSQIEFANKLGISPASLSSIYTGRTNPTSNHVMAIHKAFPQINVNWLMFGEGEMCDSNLTNGLEENDGGSASSERSLFNNDEENAEVGIASVSPILSSGESGGFEGGASSWGHDAQDGISSRGYGREEYPAGKKHDNVNIIDKPIRKIKEIRVFFSDGTYEAFVPSGK